MQQRAERKYLSRIIAANNIMNALFMVAASLLSIAVLGAGFSSSLAVPGLATNRLACPLAFNKNAANDWVSGVRVVKFKNKKEANKRAEEIFDLLNEAFAEIYGSVPLTEKQIRYYVKKYFPFADFIPLLSSFT